MKFPTNTIKELAEKWGKFKKRQERILNRNINSDEYHYWKKQEPFNTRSVIYAIRLESWFSEGCKIKEKELYQNTTEGMFDWINDGEKD